MASQFEFYDQAKSQVEASQKAICVATTKAPPTSEVLSHSTCPTSSTVPPASSADPTSSAVPSASRAPPSTSLLAFNRETFHEFARMTELEKMGATDDLVAVRSELAWVREDIYALKVRDGVFPKNATEAPTVDLKVVAAPVMSLLEDDSLP
ncbi:hypothetical protein K7X08_016734 [Anisodus acutangulus]|uniref:Uncharacterized protein n=1 Tax=Anisodus acutangulus TaxID=402998 RepID=A0A9Q1LTZ7_9SOLA|nr:hypothetical protein K7X08_016734 [Anisodus acutangulus]